MAKLTEQDLKRNIKEQSYKNVYLLYGDEKMLVSMYAKKLQEKIAGKSPSDFSFHRFNEDSTIEQIVSAIDIIPFADPYNYMAVTDLSVDKLSEGDLKIFYKALEDLPPTTVIVIAMTTYIPDKKKMNAFKKLIDAVDKNGIVVEFSKKSQADLKKLLMGWAAKRGLTLKPENAAKITEYAGTDLNVLKNEMDKLCAYVGEGEITADAVEMLVTKNLATRVFDMTDAVTSGNWDKAYKCLDLLFYQREEPVMILSELSNTYTDMYRVRSAVESGMRAEDVAKDFDYKRREFRLKKAERASARLTTEDICSCLECLAEVNTEMNSGSSNKRLLLEQLIAKLMMTGKRVRK